MIIKRGRQELLDRLNTDLYGITAEEYSLGRTNIEVVTRMVNAGIKVIQYREKDKSILEKYRQGKELREITFKAGALLIINDHIDLALSIGADGVHVGQDDLPYQAVRELVGENMMIGVSTHSPEQAQAAIRNGADYIGVGPLFQTFTKKDVGNPVGLQYLEYAVSNIQVPCVAIGGIKLHNLPEVRDRGAKCVSLVTEIVGAKDIEQRIEEIRKIFHRRKHENNS